MVFLAFIQGYLSLFGNATNLEPWLQGQHDVQTDDYGA